MTNALLDPTTESLLRTVTAAWESNLAVAAITPLTPDASKRRYYRLQLNSEYRPGQRTAIAMVFDSTVPAEVVGQSDVPSDMAYVELTKFLYGNGVKVPELLFDCRERSVLLVEDVGEETLASYVADKDDDEVRLFYEKAINQIIAIQHILPRPGFFPFERRFTAALYVKEMREFTEFLLPSRNCPAQTFSLCVTFFDMLADELQRMPLVLCHRDFHSWNLTVDQSGAVRVIDFQDALLGTPYYDIASLLNDRDTDALLGPELCAELLESFFKQSGSQSINDFARVLLQRDLKVAGRFAKLVHAGKPEYVQWIEGTVARIGRMLLRLARTKGSNPQYGLVYEELRRYLPEIA